MLSACILREAKDLLVDSSIKDCQSWRGVTIYNANQHNSFVHKRRRQKKNKTLVAVGMTQLVLTRAIVVV